MYIPKHFEEARLDVLHDLMRAHPFASFITMGADGLSVDHLPFTVSPEPPPFGVLRCHVARANPVWKGFSTSIESLVVFNGPHAYISPSWYASKKEHGKVVPTWNYAVVHAFGWPQVKDEPDWLTDLLVDLTDQHEAAQTYPWKISDAPKEYTDKMLRSIVGIEIPITRIYGKWKQSQNRSVEDRQGVIAALETCADHQSKTVAELVRSTLD